MRIAPVLCSLSMFAVGCQAESSADLETHELRAQIEAQAQSSGVTEVSVRLEKAEGVIQSVELSEEDTLLARLGNVEQVLKRRDDRDGNGVHYVATLPGNAEGELVLVRFAREHHRDASAELVLPAPIEVTRPHGDINFFWADVSDSVTVEWHGGARADDVEIFYEADCDTTREEDTVVTNDGGSAFVSFPFGDEYGRCDFDMTVKRRNHGTMTGGWQGDAYATTADRVSFQID